jgi:hypothetical protein
MRYLRTAVTADDEHLDAIGEQAAESAVGIGAYLAVARSARVDTLSQTRLALYAHHRALLAEQVSGLTDQRLADQLAGEARALRLVAAMLDGDELKG